MNIKKLNIKKFITNSFKKKYCAVFNSGKDKQLKIIDPIEPEYVLLGLIFVSFLPLINLPKIYPPISDRKVETKIQKRIVKEYSVLPLKK